MCFHLLKSSQAKIAKEDIECWKLLIDGNRPPFYGVHYRTEPYVKGILSPRVRIRKARDHDPMSDENCRVIEKGYHSYIDGGFCVSKAVRYRSIFDVDVLVKRFIIPKGTRYYRNGSEYVSETIMLVEE